MDQKKLVKFMKTAVFQAELWSKDPNSKVCALVVDPVGLQILSTGYNGIPRGVPEHTERWSREGGEKYFWVEHAERNAIFNAGRHGTALEGSVLICNKFPCADCARAIIQCGISQVITYNPDWEHPRWSTSWNRSAKMLAEAKVPVVYI